VSEAYHGAAVIIDRLSKEFNSEGSPLLALSEFSLILAPAEFLTIVGPSGCGKSTLLRIVAGLDEPTSGTVSVGGQTVKGPSTRHGVVFQRPSLFPWLDVLGNVTFGPWMQGRKREDCRADAYHYLEAVGLKGFEHYRVYNLSGGMQHRVALARALISRPEVLLMDEPFGALDAQTRLVMQELLVGIWQADRSTLLFITHDVDEAIALSDRVVVMTARPGRLKAEYRISLPRPRDLSVITSPEFAALKRDVLNSIQEEARRTEREQFDKIRSVR